MRQFAPLIGAFAALPLIAACWGPGEPCLTPAPAGPAATAARGEGPTVIATVPVGHGPQAVRVNPATDRVYVANKNERSGSGNLNRGISGIAA